jgi:hypothetical protein
MMDAEPKSPSFTKPGSDSRMFPAFTSLMEQSTDMRHISQEGWEEGFTTVFFFFFFFGGGTGVWTQAYTLSYSTSSFMSWIYLR